MSLKGALMKLFSVLAVVMLLIQPSWARTKEEARALFRSATTRLKETGIESKVPKVGDQFPDLKLAGKSVSEWTKAGPLVVTFYRGGWCPYCVAQLKQINEELQKITNLKAELIAISPEQEREVKKTKSKNDIKFPLISDKDNAMAKKLNLVFQVEDEVVKEYKNFGIDLQDSQGNSKNELPIPATFVIGADRKITYAFVDADYTKRAEVSSIISAVEASKSYTGVDIKGKKRTCTPMTEKVCTKIFTPEDGFGNQCTKDGFKAIQCDCHDWICVK